MTDLDDGNVPTIAILKQQIQQLMAEGDVVGASLKTRSILLSLLMRVEQIEKDVKALKASQSKGIDGGTY